MTERTPVAATHVDPGVWLSSQLENTAECAGLTTQSPPWLETGAEPVPDNNPRLRDIIVLMLFAVLLRLVETLDRDKPGWWLEKGEKGDD